MMVPRRNGFDIFDEVFNDPFFTKKESKLMKTDVREKDGNYVLDIDLPGYDKNDIKIELTDGYLTVTASRTEHKEEKEKHNKYIHQERFFGECSRSYYAGENVKEEDIKAMLEEAKMDPDGKTVLYDGRTGDPFDSRISVGVMYMIKLHHMVDDKLHARATGPYSLVTQQPLGGKAQLGGQRFGEMEVWALEAYGASHVLQEILTYKSDDVVGRVKVYEALVKGQPLPKPGIPEAFRVLIKEFQALGLDISVINNNDDEVSFSELERKADLEDNPIAEEVQNERSFDDLDDDNEIDNDDFDEENIDDIDNDIEDSIEEGDDF